MDSMEKTLDKNLFSDINFYWETIEVTWEGVSNFIQKNIDINYDLILHLGVATNETKMRIETIAQNISKGNDINGKPPKGNEIIQNGNNLITNIPIDLLTNFCINNKNVRISDDAGSYLCNYIYYNALHYLNSKITILFIHIADFQKNKNAVNIEIQTEYILKLLFIVVE